MIEDLERFIRIYEAGSLTKAAKLSHLTQPAISVSLQKLEKKLKTKLISRSNKHFFITQDGKAVYQMAQRIITIWHAMQNPSLLRENIKNYTVGLFDNAAMQMAKEKEFLAEKKYSVELIIDVSSKLKTLLKQGMLDVCILILDNELKNKEHGILVQRYFEELLPVSAKKFALPIKKIPFLLYNKGSHTREYIDETFFKRGIKPLIVAQSTSITFIKELAMQGRGVAILPKNFVGSELTNKTLVRQSLDVSFKREIGIFLSPDTDLTPSSPLITMITQILAETL